MPISNRTPAKDLKKNLTVAETTLRKADEAVQKAQELGLKPEEVEVLEKSRDVLLDARIRSEFPVVSRIFEDIKGKLEAGEELELSKPQIEGLLDVMEDLSFAENSVLNKLRDLGVISEADFDAFVQPHRDASNELRTGGMRKAKYGALSFANMSAGTALGMGVAIAAGGPVGTLGAIAVSMGYGMVVGKKIGGKINEAAFLENASLGMNQTQGKEAMSEVMLIASRAISGQAAMDTGGTFLDRLQRDLEIGNMMVNARVGSGAGFAALEKPFVEMAASYLEGIGGVAAKLEKGELTEAQAKKAVFDVRNQSLAETNLEQVAQLAITAYVKDPDGQKLALIRQMAASGADLAQELADNDGSLSAESIQTLATMLMLYHNASDNVGAISERGKKLLVKLANGEKLDEGGVKQFQSQVAGFAQKQLEERGPELEVTGSDAKKTAQEAFSVLWGTVVPGFQELEDAPVAKKLRHKELPDGGYEVSGTFKGGFLGWGSEGDFKVKIDNVGNVDSESMQIDLGEDFMKDAAKVAFETFAEQTGLGGKVSDVEVVKQGKAPDDNYELTARVGGQSGKVQITPMGFVAWDKMTVG